MPKIQPDPFDTLILPALERLFRAAYRLAGNSPDAQDLVQDTCVLACENLDSLSAARHPDRWLMRVLYNRYIDGARRRERSPVVPISPGTEAVAADFGPEPAVLAEQDDEERIFQRACAQLNETQRVLLSLRAEGYGLVEIEEITGISRDVLRARLHRARLSLTRYLDEQGHGDGSVTRIGSGR